MDSDETMDLEDRLLDAGLRPCREAANWLSGWTDPDKAWDACQRYDWMLWLLNRSPCATKPRLRRVAAVLLKPVIPLLPRGLAASGRRSVRLLASGRTDVLWSDVKAEISRLDCRSSWSSVELSAASAMKSGLQMLDPGYSRSLCCQYLHAAITDSSYAIGSSIRASERHREIVAAIRDEFPDPPSRFRSGL